MDAISYSARSRLARVLTSSYPIRRGSSFAVPQLGPRRDRSGRLLVEEIDLNEEEEAAVDAYVVEASGLDHAWAGAERRSVGGDPRCAAVVSLPHT